MSDTVPPAANETLASAEDFLVQLRSAALNRRTCLARAFGGLRPLCALCDVAACGLKLEVTGHEHLAQVKSQALIAYNHESSMGARQTKSNIVVTFH